MQWVQQYFTIVPKAVDPDWETFGILKNSKT